MVSTVDSSACTLQQAITSGADIPFDSESVISALSPRGALLSPFLFVSRLSTPSLAVPRAASTPPTLQLMPQPGTAWKSVQNPRLCVPSSCRCSQSNSSSVCAARVGYKYYITPAKKEASFLFLTMMDGKAAWSIRNTGLKIRMFWGQSYRSHPGLSPSSSKP